MVGRSKIARIMLVGVLVVFFAAACQLNLGLSDLDLPFVPTETSTPTPPATLTPTPTVPPKPDTSNELFQVEVLENDSTIFTDKGLGYQLEFSPEWLVVPLDEEMQAEILENASAELDETIVRVINVSMQQAGIRMVAMDYTRRYEVVENYMGNINIILDETEAIKAMELQAIIDETVAEMPELLPEANAIYQAIQTNAQGIEYGVIIITFERQVFGAPVQEIVGLFQLDAGLLTITGAGHEESYLDMERSFKNVFDSFTFVE